MIIRVVVYMVIIHIKVLSFFLFRCLLIRLLIIHVVTVVSIIAIIMIVIIIIIIIIILCIVYHDSPSSVSSSCCVASVSLSSFDPASLFFTRIRHRLFMASSSYSLYSSCASWSSSCVSSSSASSRS